MFNKILIANRGEIACRVIKTARKMGIMTIAVYSDADADALHVRMAHEAVRIGEAPSADSYLRIDRILDAIATTGAEAVHPGYGFLSENARFATALAKQGVAFIGPGERAITSMGDKITSKRIAQEAGVNTIPGYADVIEGAEHAVEIAGRIGYPVMLKATAGGGGKGMRAVYDDAECRDGYERATNEAQSSFGDGRVFAEKLIEQPRHIEIQIIADQHGNIVHLGERECSIQRRHQKVIEESPSPFLDPDTREAMGGQAIALARAVDYVSAGTVEFIVDADKNFYFLEMNTRLQVEHPVTEMVTGQDLVELMIRVAAGEPLPLSQKNVKQNGWAIEARVYAEDPLRNFLPSIGRLRRYQPPPENAQVRIDTGVEAGSEVSIFYDPMIAKLVTHGASREQAIDTMSDALDAYYIHGVRHNGSFLNAVVSHERFRRGQLTTNFIAEEFPDGFHGKSTQEQQIDVVVVAAAAIHHLRTKRAAQISGRTRRLSNAASGHRHVGGENSTAVEIDSYGVARDNNAIDQSEAVESASHDVGAGDAVDDSRAVKNSLVVVADNVQHPVRVWAQDDGIAVERSQAKHFVKTDWRPGQPIFRAEIDGASVRLQVDDEGVGYRLKHRGTEMAVLILTPIGAELIRHMIEKPAPDLSRFLLSPMPGLLVQVAAQAGDEVEAGDELAVIEAMKMENSLRSTDNLVVKAVLAKEGDSLEVDQPILEFE